MTRRRPLRVTLRRGQRGLSLLEVLVAFFLLFVVTLAILEMLSMAYIVNQATEMRTDLTYKAQVVVEQVRLQSVLDALNGTTNACCPLQPGVPFVITDQSDACFDSYWGASGANIVEANPRYELRYQVTTLAGAGGNNFVVVEAVPGVLAGYRYAGDLGGSPAGKVVRYVAEL